MFRNLIFFSTGNRFIKACPIMDLQSFGLMRPAVNKQTALDLRPPPLLHRSVTSAHRLTCPCQRPIGHIIGTARVSPAAWRAPPPSARAPPRSAPTRAAGSAGFLGRCTARGPPLRRSRSPDAEPSPNRRRSGTPRGPRARPSWRDHGAAGSVRWVSRVARKSSAEENPSRTARELWTAQSRSLSDGCYVTTALHCQNKIPSMK